MKGVVLAGGLGTRLYPLTLAVNKHLLPVGREPMIYNPIRKLVESGIDDILIVTSSQHMGDIVTLLGSGKDLACSLTYKVQDEAKGIADALRLAEGFAHNEKIVVILGDNVTTASIAPYVQAFQEQEKGARVLLKHVHDPSRYGVAALDERQILEIQEKPTLPKSNFAVIGYYMFDKRVFDIIRSIEPSARGEYEITSVNNTYIRDQEPLSPLHMRMKCFPVYLMTNVDYSVVVPVYNSEESLSELHHRLVPVFEKLHQDFELILIDDGSRDKSWEVMQKLHEKYKRVKIVQLMKNFGQNNALMCGLNFASGNRMIIMDDDLQHLPEEIPKLISKMDECYDVVYGKYLKKKHVWYRNIASTLVYGSFSKMIGLKMKVSAFKIINRQVVNEIIKFKSQNPHIDIYIARVLSPQRISNVIVRHASRKYGETNYNFWTLSKWALDILFNFTTYPLTLAIIIGFFFSIFSFFLAFLYFISYFLTDIHVSGFTTLILAVTFFSGIILFVIGIIGRYIGSIFLDVNNKPQFVIRNVKK